MRAHCRSDHDPANPNPPQKNVPRRQLGAHKAAFAPDTTSGTAWAVRRCPTQPPSSPSSVGVPAAPCRNPAADRGLLITTSAISKLKCNYYGLIRDNRERHNLLKVILAVINLPDPALQGRGCLDVGAGMFQPPACLYPGCLVQTPAGAEHPGGQHPPGSSAGSPGPAQGPALGRSGGKPHFHAV